jgi:mRNA (guanine-N7-)-methyltransferase
MPFDPVRDAVLNSPIATSQPPFYTNRNESPTSASSSSSVGPLISPSLGRRATDLAVLLNAEPDDPPTPARASSLSHILLPHRNSDDKLTHVESLRRNDHPWPDVSQRPPSSSDSKQILTSSPSSQTFDTGTSSSFIASFIPPNSPRPSSSSSRPKSLSTARPRTASMSTTHSASATTPYKPRHRLTPADSVLRPITYDEIASYRETYSIGTQRLKKRKREESSEPDSSDQPPSKKLAGDVGVVVEHCE